MTVDQSWILFWTIIYTTMVVLVIGSIIVGKLIMHGLHKIKLELIEYLTE